MQLRKIRIALALVALVAGAAALITTPWSSGSKPSPARTAVDPHASVHLSKAQIRLECNVDDLVLLPKFVVFAYHFGIMLCILAGNQHVWNGMLWRL